MIIAVTKPQIGARDIDTRRKMEIKSEANIILLDMSEPCRGVGPPVTGNFLRLKVFWQ